MALNIPQEEKLNRLGIMKYGDGVRIFRDVPHTMTKHDALFFAAWLVRIADIRSDEFPAILREVRGLSGDIPR